MCRSYSINRSKVKAAKPLIYAITFHTVGLQNFKFIYVFIHHQLWQINKKKNRKNHIRNEHYKDQKSCS